MSKWTGTDIFGIRSTAVWQFKAQCGHCSFELLSSVEKMLVLGKFRIVIGMTIATVMSIGFFERLEICGVGMFEKGGQWERADVLIIDVDCLPGVFQPDFVTMGERVR